MLQKILGNTNRLQSLDFLRGIAILIVFLTHFGIFDLQAVGVDLFFVLSGHLVSLSLFSSLNKFTGRTSYLIFFINRLLRIIPAYYTFLIAGYFLGLLLIHPISPQDLPIPREFPQYFFFYRNYGGLPSRWSMEHLWSLSVEEQFYWIFPLLVAFFAFKIKHRLNQLAAAALVLLTAGIGFKMQALITDFAEWPTYTHNRLDAFGWGILITLVLKKPESRYQSWFNNKVLLLTGTALLAVCLTLFSPLPELVLRTISPICWFLIIMGIYNAKSMIFTPFRVVAYFSYGIYLWHFLFIIPVQHYFGKGWLAFLIYTLVTSVFAFLSTFYIERPFMRIRDRVLRRLFPSKYKTVVQVPEVPIP